MKSKSKSVLEQHLRVTLHAKADARTPIAHRFDPTRPPWRDDIDEVGVSANPQVIARRRRPIVTYAAAAVLIAAGVVGGVLVHRGSTPSSQVHSAAPVGGPSTTVASAGEKGDPIAATWLPAGYAPWSAEILPLAATTTPDSKATQQLFSNTHENGQMIAVNIRDQSAALRGTPMTVRGHAGVEMSPTIAGSTLIWNEDSFGIVAQFKGVSVADAVAFLNSLKWQHEGSMGEFAAPTSGTWALLGTSTSPTPFSPLSEITYTDGDPTSDSVIEVMAGRTVAPTGATLGGLFNGTKAADGTTHLYNASTGTLSWTSPDGRWATVTNQGGKLGQDTLLRIAENTQSINRQQFGAIHTAADARVVAAYPVLAQMKLPAGTVEVRGTSTAPHVICLIISGTRSCGIRYPLSKTGSPISASVIINGTWWVAVAAPQQPVLHDSSPSTKPGNVLPAQTGTSGGWSFALASPDASVQAYTATIQGTVFDSNMRPTW